MQRVVEQRWGCQWTLSTKHFRLGMCRLDESEQQECTRRGPHENHNDEDGVGVLVGRSLYRSIFGHRSLSFLFGFEDEKVLSSPLSTSSPPKFRTNEYIESGQRT